MTKQDDALRNLENPLYMRSRSNGGSMLSYVRMDNNILNVPREAGVWNAGRVPYLKGEEVSYQGARYRALVDNSVEPSPQATVEWRITSGISGRGAMLSSTQTAGTIGSGWSPVPFDNLTIPGVGCTLDIVADTIEFEWKGFWLMSVFLNVSHNEQNQSRLFFLRMQNITDNTTYGQIQLYVARNQPGTLFSSSFLVEVSDADITGDDKFQLQIGNTSDSFSSVNFEGTGIDLVLASVL